MRLSVLPGSEIPVYRQIFSQISSQILSGALPAGEALPPIRTVSKELGVSVITVRGAWDALEAAGLIETRTGSGCFVKALSGSEREEMRSKKKKKALSEYIENAKSLGYSEREAENLLREYW